MKLSVIISIILMTFTLASAQSISHNVNFGYGQNFAVGEWNGLYVGASEIYVGYEYKTSNDLSILLKTSYLFVNQKNYWIFYDRHDIHLIAGLKYYLNGILDGLHVSGMLGISIIKYRLDNSYPEVFGTSNSRNYNQFNFDIELGYEFPLNETINLDICAGYNSTRFTDFKNDFLLLGVGTSIQL